MLRCPNADDNKTHIETTTSYGHRGECQMVMCGSVTVRGGAKELDQPKINMGASRQDQKEPKVADPTRAPCPFLVAISTTSTFSPTRSAFLHSSFFTTITALASLCISRFPFFVHQSLVLEGNKARSTTPHCCCRLQLRTHSVTITPASLHSTRRSAHIRRASKSFQWFAAHNTHVSRLAFDLLQGPAFIFNLFKPLP